MTYRAILATALCILFLFGHKTVPAETIRIGTWKTAQTIQPFFYTDFFTGGETLQVIAFTNPADQKTALLAGNLTMTGTTLAHAIHSAVQGQPVVVVATLCNKCSALVAGNKSSISTISDLRGKKIGYVPGTMHEILLREALLRADLSPGKDVYLTRVDFFDMGLALARGDIAAFLSGEPFPTLAVQKGYGRIMAYPYYNESVGSINAAMLVTRKTVEKNPELVYELVKAHAKATDYLKTNRSTWLKKATEFGTPLDTLEQASENMELSWQMDMAFIDKTRALGERMQALGLISKQPEYEKLFDLRFVERIAEEFSN